MRTTADSILTGPPPGPCVGLVLSTNYEGGVDAYGHPVTPADVSGAAMVHLDSETLIPVIGGRHGTQAMMRVTVQGLSAGLDAPVACLGH